MFVRAVMLILLVSAELALTRPADAAPALQATSAAARIVADMTIAVTPNPGMGGVGWCIQLDPGLLSVSVQAVGGADVPVSFSFNGYRGSDPIASIRSQVGAAQAAFTTPL